MANTWRICGAIQPGRSPPISGSCLCQRAGNRFLLSKVGFTKDFRRSLRMDDGWRMAPTSLEDPKYTLRRSQRPKASGRFQVPEEHFRDGGATVKNYST